MGSRGSKAQQGSAGSWALNLREHLNLLNPMNPLNPMNLLNTPEPIEPS
jgi:hypothetical protein